MEESNVTELNLFRDSARGELKTPLNNHLKDVAATNQEDEQYNDHWKYLSFDEGTKLYMQNKNNKNINNFIGKPSSSNEIRSTVEAKTEGAHKIRYMAKTNLSGHDSHSDEEEIWSDSHLKNASAAGEDSQQANNMEPRRKSIIFSTKQKSISQKTENEKLDDSGVVLDDSTKIRSAMEIESPVTDERSTTLKTNLFYNHTTTDEDDVFLNNRSKNKSMAANSQKAIQNERRKQVFSSKRKLDSLGIIDEGLDESCEKPNKRGRGKYKLRDLSTRSLLDEVTKKELVKKYRSNNSVKGNTNQMDNEDETENTDGETEEHLKIKTKTNKTEHKDELLSESQIEHNYIILKILNEGSLTKLKTLSRIGPKTAMMIYQYRKLNGKIKSIRDLEDMPGWSAKFFEQFLSANNIVLH